MAEHFQTCQFANSAVMLIYLEIALVEIFLCARMVSRTGVCGKVPPELTKC